MVQSRGAPTRQHSLHSFEPRPALVFGRGNLIQVDSDGAFLIQSTDVYFLDPFLRIWYRASIFFVNQIFEKYQISKI